MPIVTLRVAKAQLSRLIEAALSGEDVVISKGDRPVVRLVPIPQGQFKFGVLEPDALGAGTDLFSPMDADDLRLGRGVADNALARNAFMGVTEAGRAQSARP